MPRREGDRWVCNRSLARGGVCDHAAPGGGPTPEGQCCLVKQCRPRRTLRSIRGRWLRGAILFTLGAVLMLLGAANRNALVKPGPLSSHHAQVLAGAATSDRCAACHPGANKSNFELLQAALAGHDGQQLTQSQACLECHQDLQRAGAAPLLAHGLPEGAFPFFTGEDSATQPVSLSLGGGARGATHDDPVACATCHQEHHGANHNLSAMTNARCQACHEEQYQGFAADHPDFVSWPVARPTRIAFDHTAHESLHFSKAGRAFDCATCHLRDATGDLTDRPTYQQACASCHDEDLRKSFGAGLEFVRLPTIDPEALTAYAAAPGVWPDGATGDFDGDLPALMRLLLAADPQAAEALEELGADASFFDVDADDQASVVAGAKLLSALRSLLDELQEEGHEALHYRVRTLLGKRAGSVEDYVGRLPVELIDELQGVWFGRLEPAPAYDAIEDRRTGGGWQLDHQSHTLAYHPTGHDDPLVRAWIDLAIRLPEEQADLRDTVLSEWQRPGAPGGCFECHRIETTPTGLAVNWQGRQRLTEPRGFTRFSHRPHLLQPKLADCTHCHQTNAQRAALVSNGGSASTPSAGDFVVLSKSACVECHQPHAAGDSCTQCHNYHVASPAAGRLVEQAAAVEGLRAALRLSP
ncbi:hypothetical protein [Botrimarina hoheduenensis]|uniref:hypothetical protein n=1 Tax=Botrimarina hoheduenensis TaxID=2528000 RepID=UPI0011B6AE98|nr:hypothetical protein [Botrimarina hoheduenensis]